MKKKFVYVTVLMFLIVIAFFNKFIRAEYDINLIQYFKSSLKSNSDDRNWLNQHGPIIYGADQNSPPLRYLDSESNQYKGIVVDYISALSIELGTEIRFKPLLWSEALDSLAQGKTDVCDMFPSSKRAKNYFFSDPIYNLRGVILVSRNEKEIKNLKTLENKRVAVPKGDYALEFLSSNVKNINFAYTPDIKNAALLLQQGEVDAVVGDEPVISYFIEELKITDSVKILDPPLYENGVVLAVPKSETKLLNIINKGIFNLKKKKVVEKVQQKWFGISAPISKEKVSEKSIAIIGLCITIFLLISYLMYCYNKILQNEVKKRTEELRLSRNDLQITFDGLTHFMIVINSNCDIINVNRSFCNYTKLQKSDAVRRNCRDFPDLLFTNCDDCILKNTFISRKEYQMEIVHNSKIFEASTFPLEGQNNSVVKVLVVIKDITDLRASERQLLQSNKMAAVGQLAAGVAHEIRNPLGLIRNYVYILKSQIDIENEKSNKAIFTIEQSLNKAGGIIDNLLNFSRISGVTSEWTCMKNLIESVLSLEHKLFENQSVDVELECAENLKLYINQESLKHILLNLISNSIDAMPAGGKLVISCKEQNKRLLLSCSDTGVGIEKENIDNIFNPFFTTKPPGKGTGLGLYITYNEIQKLGGEIHVQSEVNKGTTFEITLPFEGGVNYECL